MGQPPIMSRDTEGTWPHTARVALPAIFSAAYQQNPAREICDLGYFDDETCRNEPIDKPFGPKLLSMSPE